MIHIQHNEIEFELFKPNIEEVLRGGSKMNKVKMYRNAIGLSQEKMAEAIGVSINTYRSLEENASKFTVEQINKYMAVINKFDSNVKASDIFCI